MRRFACTCFVTGRYGRRGGSGSLARALFQEGLMSNGRRVHRLAVIEAVISEKTAVQVRRYYWIRIIKKRVVKYFDDVMTGSCRRLTCSVFFSVDYCMAVMYYDGKTLDKQ